MNQPMLVGEAALQACERCRQYFRPRSSNEPRRFCSHACSYLSMGQALGLSQRVPLWDRIKKRAHLDTKRRTYRPELGPCWVGVGSNNRGYAQISDRDAMLIVHVVAYRRLIGPIPTGLQLDHLCRVRHCFNPFHLEPVTPRVNVLRSESPAAKNAVKTHCPLGHVYDDENTYWYRRKRHCRMCKRTNLRLWRARRSWTAYRASPRQPIGGKG